MLSEMERLQALENWKEKLYPATILPKLYTNIPKKEEIRPQDGRTRGK
jgi:hypothetical protein